MLDFVSHKGYFCRPVIKSIIKIGRLIYATQTDFWLEIRTNLNKKVKNSILSVKRRCRAKNKSMKRFILYSEAMKLFQQL